METTFLSETLTSWILREVRKKSAQKIKDFFLLRDYCDGELTDSFFLWHINEAKKALSSVDNVLVRKKLEAVLLKWNPGNDQKEMDYGVAIKK